MELLDKRSEKLLAVEMENSQLKEEISQLKEEIVQLKGINAENFRLAHDRIGAVNKSGGKVL